MQVKDMARKKNTKLDDTYEILKDRIIKLKYLPEETLSVNELAQEFDLSRPALKEILMRLSADSLVEETSTKFAVSSFTVQDIIELYQVREALECKCGELILMNGGLTEAQLREIEELNDEIQQCVKDRRYRDGFTLDDKFHTLLMEYSKNKALMAVFDRIRIQVSRGRWLTLFNSDHNDTWEEHMKIINALKAKDPDAVRRALSSHIGAAGNDIGDIFKNKDYERALFVLHHMKEGEK